MPDLVSTTTAQADGSVVVGLIPPRTRLRRFRDSDAEVFFQEAFSRADAMQFESSLPHTHVQQTRIRIRQLINSKHAEEFVVEAVVEQDEAVPVASSAVASVTPSSVAFSTFTVASDPEIPVAPPMMSQEKKIPPTQLLADEFGDFSVSEDEDLESEEGSFVPVGKVCMYKCEGDWWIGYLIFPKYWRKGYATEAVGTLIEWALRCHSAFAEVESTSNGSSSSSAIPSRLSPQFNADIDPRNHASLQLLVSKFNARRVGFQKNSMQVGGQWVDSVFLALNRQDFESSKWKQQFMKKYSHLPLMDRRAERNLHRRKPQVGAADQQQQAVQQRESRSDAAFLEYM